MSYKNNGFTSIECIVSLSIICVAVYMVSTSIYSSYNLVNSNEKNIEMLNIAKTYIEDMKYFVRNNNIEQEKYCNLKEYEGYKIETSIEKSEDYYRCYKIDVKVKLNVKSMELSSYITK
ncbi:type II secretion system protein [Romboutsia maritimum]|uniref:Type II secretion system protein n=1 Tax=Romboutsia maritimum TaxID=2020948 RepID=A0A371IWG1_9FIRM|nr:type II secretion system protein [Romboutsia maritimum]RDY24815.1 type II secretion system protein [Romboutsia maritimum]